MIAFEGVVKSYKLRKLQLNTYEHTLTKSCKPSVYYKASHLHKKSDSPASSSNLNKRDICGINGTYFISITTILPFIDQLVLGEKEISRDMKDRRKIRNRRRNT